MISVHLMVSAAATKSLGKREEGWVILFIFQNAHLLPTENGFTSTRDYTCLVSKYYHTYLPHCLMLITHLTTLEKRLKYVSLYFKKTCYKFYSCPKVSFVSIFTARRGNHLCWTLLSARLCRWNPLSPIGVFAHFLFPSHPPPPIPIVKYFL